MGIWKASLEQAQEAVGVAVAVPDDFLIIQAMQIWEKDGPGMSFLERSMIPL
jgi:hypothetical protein